MPKVRQKTLQTVRMIMKSFLLLMLLYPVSVWAQSVDQKIDGFSLEGFQDDGQRAWEVKGATADILGEQIEISDVDANAFGEHDVNITARTGTLDKKNGDIFLKEDVVVTTAKGSQLKTDSLYWGKKANTVSTEDRAVITDEGMTVSGQGLKANSELKTAQLGWDVQVEVEAQGREALQKQDRIVITCAGPMELDQLNHRATLRKDVIAVRGDQTLKADHVEVIFDAETRKIKTIICTDNVVVTRGEHTTYSDKAIYSAVDQKVILVGRPKLVLPSEELEEENLFAQ
ncbi:MAG: LPS export ABC transporter periplasmic protein LptC [Candidatus Omnitrophota bacterium]